MTAAEDAMTRLIGRAPRRIAIVRALHLGDMLLAIPALRAIRHRFPSAEVTLIGLPWASSFAARFASFVNGFQSFPGYPGIAEAPVEPARTAAFIAAQRRRYDLVIQMHGSGAYSNPFALELEGAATVGYVDGSSPAGLTLRAAYPHDQHEIARCLGLAALVGCPSDDPRLEFPLVHSDEREATLLLGEVAETGRPLIGMHPGAKFPSRRWPPERFATTGDELARRHGARVVITGGAGEEGIATEVAARMETEPLVLAGNTSLGGLGALIARCDLFISNDTGPAHLAAAVDTPSVVLFGPADLRRWAPLDGVRHRVLRSDVPCSPCGHEVCPIDHRCLRWIESADVVAVAEQLLLETGFACVV